MAAYLKVPCFQANTQNAHKFLNKTKNQSQTHMKQKPTLKHMPNSNVIDDDNDDDDDDDDELKETFFPNKRRSCW